MFILQAVFIRKMKLYAVVHFLGTDDVEAVPLSWLKTNESETVCSWPPYPSRATSRIMNAIAERIVPQDDWQSFPAEIIRKCGQLHYSLHFVC